MNKLFYIALAIAVSMVTVVSCWPIATTDVVEAKYWVHYTHLQREEQDVQCSYDQNDNYTCNTSYYWSTIRTETLSGQGVESDIWPVIHTTRSDERVVHDADFSVLLGSGDTANVWSRETYKTLVPGETIQLHYNHLGYKWIR